MLLSCITGKEEVFTENKKAKIMYSGATVTAVNRAGFVVIVIVVT